MIVIYIDGGGTVEKLSPQHVYQGSNQTGVTVFAPVPTTTAMGIAFKLPDGTSTPYYPMTFIQSVEGLSQYEFTIQASLTQKSGQAAIAIQALYSDGQQTSQLIDFEIEKSVLPVLPDEPTPDVYDLLKQAIAKNASDIADNTAAIEENANAIKTNADNIAKNANAIKTNSENIAANTADIETLQRQIGNIEQLADSAQKASADAVETANNAKETADGLAESIAQANTRASQAVETANNAETTANGLADSIAQANQTASSAVETADNAVQDIAEYKNQINSDVEGLRQDIEEKQFFKGMFNSVEELKATYPTATENDYAYIIAGNQWVYTNGEWTDSGEPTPNTAVPASDTTPLMDGAASTGTESQYARGDHRHPSDTNKVNKSGDTMTGPLTSPSLTGQNGVYDGQQRVYSPGNLPEQLYVKDTRNNPATDRTPFSPHTVTPFFSNKDMPDGEWWAGIDVQGWTSDYRAWQLVSQADNGTAVDNPKLYIREFNNGKAGPWRKVCIDGTEISSTGFKQSDASKNYIDAITGDGQNFGFTGLSGNIYRLQRMLQVATDQLSPTTANGWTIGDRNLRLPSTGVYLVQANGTGIGIMFADNASWASAVLPNEKSAAQNTAAYSVLYSVPGWSLLNLVTGATISVTQVAYKRIA